MLIEQARSQPQFYLAEAGRENFGGKERFGGSCLRYYAYRKMIASKMMFVRFLMGWGGGHWQITNLGTQASPWLRVCDTTLKSLSFISALPFCLPLYT